MTLRTGALWGFTAYECGTFEFCRNATGENSCVIRWADAGATAPTFAACWQAPSKVPEIRLQQLAWAGELRIRLRLGYCWGGETQKKIGGNWEAIAQILTLGHIQGSSLQPQKSNSKLMRLRPISCRKSLHLPWSAIRHITIQVAKFS